MADKQKNAQDVTVNDLSMRSALGKVDLTPFLLELTIEENLFKPGLVGNIVLSDSYNIPEKFPVVGEETLDIDISLQAVDSSAKDTFHTIKPPPMHVNNLNTRYFTAPKAQRFTLDLFSEQFMSSTHSKISRSYRNQKISNIVADIYYEYLSDGRNIDIEPTSRLETLIIPNMRPIAAIMWLANRANADESSAINYVYYETIDGMHFKSIDSLVDEEPVFTYQYIQRSGDASGVENLSRGIQRIDSLYYLKQFDKIQNSYNGAYASKLITHDIVRKKITQYDFSAYDNFFGLNHVGTFPILSASEMEIKSASVPRVSYAPQDEENSYPITTEKDLPHMVDSLVEFYPKHNQMYSQNVGDLYDNKVEDWKLQRKAQLSAYENITLLLEVAGNSFLRVGHTVQVNIPTPESTEGDKKSDILYDKFLSGIYMVTAIKHMFQKFEAKDNKISYIMKIEITKDALEEAVINRPIREKEN